MKFSTTHNSTAKMFFIMALCLLMTGCVANQAHKEPSNLSKPITTISSKKPILHHSITFQSENDWSSEEKKLIAERTQTTFAKYITQSGCCGLTSDRDKADICLESTIIEEKKGALHYLALGISGISFGVIPTKTKVSYTLAVTAHEKERLIYKNRLRDHINTYIWLPLFFVEIAKPYSEYRVTQDVLNGFQYRLIKDLADSGMLARKN